MSAQSLETMPAVVSRVVHMVSGANNGVPVIIGGSFGRGDGVLSADGSRLVSDLEVYVITQGLRGLLLYKLRKRRLCRAAAALGVDLAIASLPMAKYRLIARSRTVALLHYDLLHRGVTVGQNTISVQADAVVPRCEILIFLINKYVQFTRKRHDISLAERAETWARGIRSIERIPTEVADSSDVLRYVRKLDQAEAEMQPEDADRVLLNQLKKAIISAGNLDDEQGDLLTNPSFGARYISGRRCVSALMSAKGRRLIRTVIALTGYKGCFYLEWAVHMSFVRKIREQSSVDREIEAIALFQEIFA